ncbi:MAG: hypothetical protein J6Y02_01280 [Pseudobutyrivibrio sp.]|nr:hypothetical protein [Pseudobutyrivibrio sp.]
METKLIYKLSDKDLKKINKEYIRRGLDKNATVEDVYSTFTPSQKKLTETLIGRVLYDSDEPISYGALASLTETQKTVLYFLVGDALAEKEKEHET